MPKSIAPSLRGGARSCSQSTARTKKSGGKAAFTFSNALRTTRSTTAARQINRSAIAGAKKRKKSLSSVRTFTKRCEPQEKENEKNR
jgi:hypothetical protein